VTYQKEKAAVTTRIYLEDAADDTKGESLILGDLLVGDHITGSNPGPTLLAAKTIAKAIDAGARYLEAYRVGCASFITFANKVKSFTSPRIISRSGSSPKAPKCQVRSEEKLS
jgi:hypothetical protein